MSLILTAELVATTVPEVELVLNCALNDSPGSVKLSATTATLKDAELLVITTDPDDVETSLVSNPVLPVSVQYKVVPFVTLVVDTLNVTDCPSFKPLTEGVIEYEGGGVVDVSLMLTDGAVATIVPDSDPVRSCAIIFSVPSVSWSARAVILNVALLLAIVTCPENLTGSVKSEEPAVPLRV